MHPVQCTQYLRFSRLDFKFLPRSDEPFVEKRIQARSEELKTGVTHSLAGALDLTDSLGVAMLGNASLNVATHHTETLRHLDEEPLNSEEEEEAIDEISGLIFSGFR
jgi:hypothetical protein